MPIIGFTNQKGGCAKSTVAVHFVYLLYHLKRQVFLVDSDAQGTSSSWLKMLQADIPFKAMSNPDELLEELPKLAESYEWVVVDAPAALSEVTRAVVLWSDLVVVPCQPSGVDLASASDTIRLIRQAQAVRKGEPKAIMFVSRAIKGTRLKDEAIQTLKELTKDLPEFAVLDQALHQRQVIADAYGQGVTVFNLSSEPAKEAKKEFESLFQAMFKAMEQVL